MKQEKCLIPKYLLPGHDQLDKTDWALLLGLCISRPWASADKLKI